MKKKIYPQSQILQNRRLERYRVACDIEKSRSRQCGSAVIIMRMPDAEHTSKGHRGGKAALEELRG